MRHGRRTASIAAVICGALLAVFLALHHGSLIESWHIHRLRSGDAEARQSAARALAAMKSRKGVLTLIDAIKEDRRETATVIELSSLGRTLKRVKSLQNRHAITLKPLGFCLYSMGKQAKPLLENHVEGITYFDEEIQRYLDVLDAVMKSWDDPGIRVDVEPHPDRDS